MRIISFLFFFSLCISSIFAMPIVMAGAGDWEEAHSFTGSVTYVNDTLPANFGNFTKSHEFDGSLRYNYDLDPEVNTTESMNVIEFFVIIILIWLPALCLNYFIPGYGLVGGMMISGFLAMSIYPSLLIVYMIMIISSIAIFWKGAD